MKHQSKNNFKVKDGLKICWVANQTVIQQPKANIAMETHANIQSTVMNTVAMNQLWNVKL